MKCCSRPCPSAIFSILHEPNTLIGLFIVLFPQFKFYNEIGASTVIPIIYRQCSCSCTSTVVEYNCLIVGAGNFD